MSSLWNRWNAKSIRYAMVGATAIVGATAAIGAASVAATDLGTRTVGMKVTVSNLCGVGSGELVITATGTATVTTLPIGAGALPVAIDTTGMTPGPYTVQASCLDKSSVLVPTGIVDTFVLVPLVVSNIGSVVPGTGISVPIGCSATDVVLVRWGIPPTNPNDLTTGVLMGQSAVPTPAPATYTVTDPAFVEGQGYAAIVYCTPVGETSNSAPSSGVLFTFASLATPTTLATPATPATLVSPTTAPATTSTIAPTTQLPSTGRSSSDTVLVALLLVGAGAGALALTRRAHRH